MTRASWARARAAQHEGDWLAAERHFARISKIDPSDAAALIERGECLRRLSRYTEAAESVRRAIKLFPNNPAAWVTLGKALQQAGDRSAARQAYVQACALDMEHSEAAYLCANLDREAGDLDRAAAGYRKALAAKPDFVEALANLGGVLLGLGQSREAVEILNRAYALRPDAPPILCSLAAVLEQEGRFDEALVCIERAQALHPELVDAVLGRARILERLGHRDEALQILAQLRTRGEGGQGVALMQARVLRAQGDVSAALAVLNPWLSESDAHHDTLLLAGQLQDRQGEYTRAMQSWKRAHASLAAMAEQRSSDVETYVARVRRMRAYLQPGLSSLAGAAPVRDEPVFLLGFPRSGTTLMEQALDRHPALQTLEEKSTVSALLREFEVMSEGREDALLTLQADQIERLRAVYFEAVDRCVERVPGTRLIDKMPLNTVSVPVLWRVFPKAKFILALRHPCDACLSCYMQGLEIKDARGDFYSLAGWAEIYAEVMQTWLQAVSTLPLQTCRVRYEDVVADFDTEIGRLLDFLGVPWNDAVRDYRETGRSPVKTPSYHQVAQPIYTHARYRWERYREEFAPALPHLNRFVQIFGYATDAAQSGADGSDP